jgi:secondary thiamine-phosphate synthase enzyme
MAIGSASCVARCLAGWRGVATCWLMPCMIQVMWLQKKIILKARSRGFHLITGELLAHLDELRELRIGLAHFFIQHTSASLSINENADPDVRRDMETHLRQLAPDGAAHYVHRMEGPDDMPAHIKSSLMGASVTLPIADGRLRLGVWQGIYLGEHRDYGGARTIIATLNGDSF